jgi:glycine/D-amino acid oxidase-like deaminating enzyme
VRIRQGAAVAEIVVDHDGVRGVKLTDGDVLPAETVVVAAGPWAMPLLTPLGIDIPVQPTLVQEVVIDPGMDLGAPPVFSDLVSKQYVHMRNGEMLFGNSAGEGATLSIDDPDVYPGHASNAAVELTAEKALHRFPGIDDPRVSTTSTGVIDMTPDNNPIISATNVDGLYLAVGMSGHGFKIAPAIGRLLADIIIDGDTTIPHVRAADFRLSRFAENDFLLSPYAYRGAMGIR